jgi:putative membrane-bound dehydrogenase-like protein
MFLHRTRSGTSRLARLLLGIGAALASLVVVLLGAETPPMQIGVARMDVTPAGPIRLTGYVARKTESEGVEQRLWAKALAIGSDREGPAILVTVDNCGVGAQVIDAVAARLKAKAGIARDHFAVCSSHTHSGPMTDGFAANIFAEDLPAEQQEHIHRYTAELTDKLESLALAALADRSPGRLKWARGTVGFAANRRTKDGPTDRSFSALMVSDLGGLLRAVVVNYACHCTTLGSEINRVHGDWAGDAQEAIEQAHPGVVAMVSIGCGADSNPSPRGGADFGRTLSRLHGRAAAAELDLLLGQGTELTQPPTCRYREFPLPFEPLPDRAGWEQRAKQSGIVGYHARRNLQRLDRGESLPTELPYRVQTWSFGDRLSMVFLAGEVVVDYALRLQRDFDPDRLWINAYANDVPCYIPSRRILTEGGYEAESSLWYYDRPARLAPETEERILGAVRDLLPESLRRVGGPRAEFLPPMKSVVGALLSFRTRPGLEVRAAASEPRLDSPVAIDFGPDGRVWVCEMIDYPSGIDGRGQAGGRITVLTDRNADGVFDESKVFASGFPYPTGLMVWGDGVLICAAPDILWAHDTDGDGRADRIETLFTGFATHNFQARVSGLRWGLDGWIYGSGSLFGGKVRSLKTGREVDASGRDFRFKPDTGEFEALAGVSQQGRTRDDFGTDYGNDNSTLLWQFPMEDRFLRRNPFVTPPSARVSLARGTDPNRVFPISRTLERFNEPQSANHLTSGCGPEIYRDLLLGADLAGNAFVCEPVHNLVRRAVLRPEGLIRGAWRAADEQDREFLASTDNWFRPVEVRTGPDGALWVVDMNRFVIEHPRWIPPERLAQLDVRAGAGTGRIWRVVPAGIDAIPLRDYTLMEPSELAPLLDSANGVERDLVHRELLRHHAREPLKARTLRLIETVIREGASPAGAAQAVAVLAGLGVLKDDVLHEAMRHADPGVRRVAVRFAEGRLGLLSFMKNLIADADPGVRFQLALTLGSFGSESAAPVFRMLALQDAGDPWIRAALLTALPGIPGAELPAPDDLDRPGQSELWTGGVKTWIGLGEGGRLVRELTRWLPPADSRAPTIPTNAGPVLQLYAALLQLNSTRSVPEAAAVLERVRARLLPAVGADFAAGRLSEPAARALIGVWTAERRSDPERLAEWVRAFDAELLPGLHAAVRDGLAQQSEVELCRRLLAGTAARPVRWRNEGIELALGRREWTVELLALLERKELGIGELTPSQRQRLSAHSDAAIATRARHLVGTGVRTERAAVVQRFASAASLRGDDQRGMREFDRLCASCHRVRGHGNVVGPDLAPYRTKPAADFLQAVLDPNSAIEPKFTAYTVELRDGRSLTGILRNETSSGLEVVQPGAVVEFVNRSQIGSIQAQPQSLMPEGLEQGLEPQALADLLTWIRGGAVTAFGTADAEAIQTTVRGLAATPFQRVRSGGRLEYPGFVGRLPLAHCRQRAGESELVWDAAVPAPEGGRVRFRFAAAMGLVSQPAAGFLLKVGNHKPVRFDATLEDEEWSDAAGEVRMRYTVRERNAEDSCGPLEIEIPAGWSAPGAKVRFSVTGSEAGSQRWFGLYELPASR